MNAYILRVTELAAQHVAQLEAATREEKRRLNDLRKAYNALEDQRHKDLEVFHSEITTLTRENEQKTSVSLLRILMRFCFCEKSAATMLGRRPNLDQHPFFATKRVFCYRGLYTSRSVLRATVSKVEV